MLDKLLEKTGLKYEDLNDLEKDYLQTQLEVLQNNKLTVEGIRQWASQMRSAVEEQLATHDLGSKQDIFLKARLRNYMLLEAFLDTPERAQKALESALSGIASKR